MYLVHFGLLYPQSSSAGDEAPRELAFWKGLGFTLVPHEAEQGQDRAGAGRRWWVMYGQRIVLSYVPTAKSEDFVRDRTLALGLHAAFAAIPEDYRRLRGHQAFERETAGWDNGQHSVFLTGPWGLEVEFVFDSSAVKYQVAAWAASR